MYPPPQLQCRRGKGMDFLDFEADGLGDGSGGASGGKSSVENFINEDVIILQRLWRNELNSVEILPYEATLVNEINDLLQQQQVCAMVSITRRGRRGLSPLLALL